MKQNFPGNFSSAPPPSSPPSPLKTFFRAPMAGEGHSCKKCGKIVQFVCGKPREGEDERYGQQVTCNTCIEETLVETNSETCSHLTL